LYLIIVFKYLLLSFFITIKNNEFIQKS
jgi:hypothetical protein